TAWAAMEDVVHRHGDSGRSPVLGGRHRLLATTTGALALVQDFSAGFDFPDRIGQVLEACVGAHGDSSKVVHWYAAALPGSLQGRKRKNGADFKKVRIGSDGCAVQLVDAGPQVGDFRDGRLPAEHLRGNAPQCLSL